MGDVRGNLFDLAIVRLADEGVPVLALARAFRRPSDDVYGLLREARDDGRLLDLPAADWPIRGNRSERVPTTAIRRATANEIDDLVPHLCVAFRLSKQQAHFLSALLAFTSATKGRLYEHICKDGDAQMKLVDVVACKVRAKLREHGFEIRTIWGYGYAIDAGVRDAILAFVSDEVAA